MLILFLSFFGLLFLPNAYTAIVLGVNNLSMYGLTQLFFFRMKLHNGKAVWLAKLFDRTVFWPLDYAYRNMVGAPQFMVGIKHELMSDLVDRYLKEHPQLTKDIRGLCVKHNVTPKTVMRSAVALGYFDVITSPNGHDSHFGNPEEFR